MASADERTPGAAADASGGADALVAGAVGFTVAPGGGGGGVVGEAGAACARVAGAVGFAVAPGGGGGGTVGGAAGPSGAGWAPRAVRKARALWDTTVPLHAIFGLSATLAGAFLAVGGWPGATPVALIVVALVFGRAAGFGLNRVIDAALDARNPRTRGRPIPTGRLSRGETLAFSAVCLAVLALAAWELNPYTLYFFPLAVAGLVVYPYGKYHTWTCHYWQVWPQFCGPMGAWLALRSDFAWPGVAFALGYGLWVAASDILFHAGDRPFQAEAGVHSAVTDLGLARGLLLSRMTHVAALGLIALAGTALGLGAGFWAALAACVLLLAYQHAQVAGRGEAAERSPVERAGRSVEQAGRSVEQAGRSVEQAPVQRLATADGTPVERTSGRLERPDAPPRDVPVARAAYAFNTNAVAGPLLLLGAALGVLA